MGLAQHGLGFMYMQGECVEQDGEKALEWFTRAAEQGLQGAMTTIGMMYRDGNGTSNATRKRPGSGSARPDSTNSETGY